MFIPICIVYQYGEYIYIKVKLNKVFIFSQCRGTTFLSDPAPIREKKRLQLNKIVCFFNMETQSIFSRKIWKLGSSRSLLRLRKLKKGGFELPSHHNTAISPLPLLTLYFSQHHSSVLDPVFFTDPDLTRIIDIGEYRMTFSLKIFLYLFQELRYEVYTILYIRH